MSLLSFSFASFVSLFTVVYALQVPHRITGQSALVREYYEKKYATSVPMDIFFIACYLCLSFQLANLLGMNTYVEQIVTVTLTTAIVTSLFCFYFRSYPQSQNFFSKWFHHVGYSSVVCDVIILNVVYIIYMFMQFKTKIKS
jgi:hypothetical protein